ncbi:uncharacterized protein [Penaeus vannamei]|uniref:uncharacterized protein n=1 Tax=Penaeus vannamei TaxID=6689 RepID=UPI00387F394D
MKLLVAVFFVATANAVPTGYRSPRPSTGFSRERGFSGGGFSGGAFSSGGGFSSGGRSSGVGGPSSTSGQGGTRGRCNVGEILHVDGSCVTPVVTRNVFVYDAPEQPQRQSGPRTNVAPPKINHNILFARIPEGGAGPEPIVVLPPRQKNVVYVLNKNEGGRGQRVIEVPPPPPSDPEVIFVSYAKGENPQLPIGVDLQTALQGAANGGGQVIGGGIQRVGGVGNGFGGAGSGFGAGSRRGNNAPRSSYGPP